MQTGGGYQYIAINGKKITGIARNGQVIYKYEEPIPTIKSFAKATVAEIKQYLDLHYQGKINLADYWKVGDTRKMLIKAMSSNTGGDETHVRQYMTMVIIGLNHDNLKTAINGKTKAAITLQCREVLGNGNNAEEGYIWGSETLTHDEDNYSNNPRRTWLNNTFFKALPNDIQPLIKTVIKKNLNGHYSWDTSGPDTEDKAFLTSYTEMFGNNSYNLYLDNKELNNNEGEQYPYYNSDERRQKIYNNNGSPADYPYKDKYLLRSPSTRGGDTWLTVGVHGEPSYCFYYGDNGIAPAFCL